MNKKYEIFKSVILSGAFQLEDMLDKITTMWVQGALTEEEKNELILMAHTHTTVDGNRAPVQAQLDAIFVILDEVLLEIAKLKNGVQEEPEEPEEVCAWYRWDGVGVIPWQTGVQCSHNGVVYTSAIDNNVWEPGAPGIDERYWIPEE